MRDKYYRSCCFYPPRYDAVIDLIKRENPAAEASGNAEEFASNAVNTCIRAVMFGDFGDCGTHHSTGGAMASPIRDRNKVKAAYKAEVAYLPVP